VEERGLDPVQAQARVDAQVDNTARLAVADVVIDTDGSMANTMGQVDALWHRIKQERARA
jgi:dephospho-CoA kinase